MSWNGHVPAAHTPTLKYPALVWDPMGVVLRLENSARKKFVANPWTFEENKDPLYGIEGRFRG